MAAPQKITTFLWFDTQAEQAAEFYTTLFPDSKIIEVQRYGEAGPGTPGTAMLVAFQLAGQRFSALNGGPEFSFTEAVSLYVDCEDQEEVDRLWTALTADGGQESQCGWLKDRWGLSWQIIPKELPRLLSDPDPEKAGRAMQAMLGMQKIDVAALRSAYDGE
ncbi:VOC family protein [Streptomyces sp. KLOTTS4A1]|uniref:VOC family protein n=1 Tax=Streptomyces sp. KLOTTS4A1 TaxID=3390996 RepID=UPI0039F5F189